MKNPSHFTPKANRDYKLVKLAQQKNDQLAFNKLMAYYEKSVYFMLLKMTNNADDARDLTVEAFEKAFRNIKQYTPVYAFSTWLFKIATNNCIDFMRRDKKTTQSIDLYDDNNELIEQINSLIDSEMTPEENIINCQKSDKMRQIVNTLKPQYKKLIELHYFDELGYKEIAELLKLPVGTVKAQLFRARENLQRSLKDKHSLN